MSERFQRRKEELRVKIRPLMTPDIIEAVLVARELPPAQITFMVTALLKVTPPWGGIDHELAGEIMLEEANKSPPAALAGWVGMIDDMGVTGALREEILSLIAALGPGDDLPGGMRRLDERTYTEIDQFKVEIRANEGQHRGRPHCCVTTDKGAVSVDIMTGEIIAGDAGKWNTPIKKAVISHSKGLKKLWDEMRPDDQKLPQASSQKK